MGPLAGVKVLEFEAIGPVPFCGMMLADMGADVLLVDRPADPRLGLDRERWFDTMLRGRRSVTLDLKSPRRRRRGVDTGAQRGCRSGGISTRRNGAAGSWSRCDARGQPDARLRAHDRLGAGRSARAARRTRHQLHRPIRRAARDRTSRWRPRASAQPGRRLRRRRHAARVRRRVRADRNATLGQGTGRRRRDGGGRVALVHDVLGHASWRPVERRARRQRARHRRAVVRRVRNGRPPASSPSAPSSPSSTRSCCGAWAGGRGASGAARPRALARAAAALRTGVRHENTRRMVRPSSKDRTRASRRCSRSRRPRLIRTMWLARRMSSWAASSSPRRRRGFRARPAQIRGAPPERGARGAEALADWGFDAAAIERLRSQGVGFAPPPAPA